MSTWVDFRQIKDKVSFSQVLPHYGLNLTAKGPELIGRCPFHQDKKPSFHVNLEKKVFHCFGCGAKGNVLEFVAAIEKVSLREAALKLAERFGISGKPSQTKLTAPTIGNPQKSRAEIKDSDQTSTGSPVSTNKPLTFHLKSIDSGHPYLVSRGITRETAEHFGVGFFPGKGSMTGRIVIPIHDEHANLVAYAGRAIDDSEPRYKLPTKFQKSLVLFNRHRVVEGSPTVFLVEGFFDCMKVSQAGYDNTVALMGNSLSESQEELLHPFRNIVLMLDGDDAGIQAAEKLAARLGHQHFVHIVDVSGQPDELSSEVIQVLLTGF